jgi:hypothetical protein
MQKSLRRLDSFFKTAVNSQVGSFEFKQWRGVCASICRQTVIQDSHEGICTVPHIRMDLAKIVHS